MRKCAIFCLALSLCSGCATTKTGEGVPIREEGKKREGSVMREGGLMQRYSGSKQLTQAGEMLRKGDTRGAAKTLGAIISGPALPGVTDEALFRLALLTLNPGVEKPASEKGQQLLRRLGKKYPKSQWTLLAAPVSELIEVAEEHKRQNKALKGTNQALTKEINELSKSIEQLKRLDQELEQKAG